VPEIMEVDSRTPGFAERGQPYPPPEVAVVQRVSGWASEHEALVALLGEAGQVPLDDGEDHFGDRHHPLACPGLRRSEGETAAAHLGELTSHAYCASGRVDIATAQRAQFAPPQAGEHG
jgi:hypothetical protein